MREYNFDLEEQQHQEMKQLGVAKKEQYVSQTVCEVFFNVLVCVCFSLFMCVCACLPPGNLCALAESEFQRAVCRLDSPESVEGVCGISPQVSVGSIN